MVKAAGKAKANSPVGAALVRASASAEGKGQMSARKAGNDFIFAFVFWNLSGYCLLVIGYYLVIVPWNLEFNH